MTVSTCALVDQANKVINIIVADPGTFGPPTGDLLVSVGNQNVGIGWSYSQGIFTPPPAPTPPAPSPAQQAIQALAAGVVLTSTGTPSLNGNYSTSTASIANINAVTTYVLLNNTFPGNVAAMPWYDMSGNAHLFPGVAQFKDFATVVANYVAAVQLYADSNGAIGPLPPNHVTIA